MKNDKKWLKESINELKTIFNGRKMGEYETGRLDSYTHVSMLIDYLDEPEKPVIPQFVANEIEQYKADGIYSVGVIFYGALNREYDEILNNWILNNQKLFVEAFFAYPNIKVEKEKKYRVRAGNRYVRFNLDGSIIGVKKDNSIVCLERLSKLPFDYKKAVESGIITLEEVTE
ncbi:DUF1642 domain-containing protein [Jeotgalibaca porci]|uniref:DUF1642 domain-containing protein n=1 Tax=Jeotgalibaca porci TaxID=1868793 RepID=UPI00359FC8C4